MPSTIAVTGATGHVGAALARRLLARGAKVRVLGRDKTRLAPLARKGAEPFTGDLANPAFLTTAFRGADAAFLMIPPNHAAPDPRAWQRSAAESLAAAVTSARLPRVCLLSSLGADLPEGTGPIVGLRDFEGRFRDLPEVSAVVLRPTAFMENFVAAVAGIKAAGAVASAVRPEVACPLVATRDIADAAASLLGRPSFEGWSVRPLLGPRDYTHAETARILGRAVGNLDLKAVRLEPAAYREMLVGFGCSPAVADDLVELDRAIDRGLLQATVTRSLENTTPTTLEKFATDTFAPAWRAV